jgi:dUTP pyrophosphatase
MLIFETIRVDKNIPLPFKKRNTDAGVDLYAAETKIIWPLTTKKLLSNHKIHITDGLFGLIQSRSGFRQKGLLIDGVIDEGYQGIFGIIVSNIGFLPRIIKKGDRVCQVIYLNPYKIEHIEVEDFSKTSNRGTEGFGSSGIK